MSRPQYAECTRGCGDQVPLGGVNCDHVTKSRCHCNSSAGVRRGRGPCETAAVPQLRNWHVHFQCTPVAVTIFSTGAMLQFYLETHFISIEADGTCYGKGLHCNWWKDQEHHQAPLLVCIINSRWKQWHDESNVAFHGRFPPLPVDMPAWQ